MSTSGFILGLFDNYDYDTYWSLYRHRGGYDGILNPMVAADQTIVSLSMRSFEPVNVQWDVRLFGRPGGGGRSVILGRVWWRPTENVVSLSPRF